MSFSAAQRRVFAATWLSYFGYYLCRKNFAVLMPLLRVEFHLSSSDLAAAIFCFSMAYAVGQFAMGNAADRLGARLVVGAGMLISAAVTAGLGFAGGLAAILTVQTLNGFAQSAGWPGLMKLMMHWFPPLGRGTVMAVWSSNYVLGGWCATVFATFAATGPILEAMGWRRAAWWPAIALGVVSAVFFLLTRADSIPGGQAPESAPAPAARWSEVLGDPAIRTIAMAFFFLKLTGGFLFWLPLFLTEHLRYSAAEAGYSSSIYDVAGFAGVLIAGLASDRWWSARRIPTGVFLLLGLAAACVCYPGLNTLGRVPNLIGMALIGLFTLGADSLIGGTAVQDAAPAGATATAAGFVNGVGALGQMASPFLISGTSQEWGWNAVFLAFALLALISAGLLCTRWTHEQRRTG